MINNSTDICEQVIEHKKKPDPLHMALALQVLVSDRYNPYVMEMTKTLVINVVPPSYNSKCREKNMFTIGLCL